MAKKKRVMSKRGDERLLRALSGQECQECQNLLINVPFCTSCGSANANFSIQIFEAEIGSLRACLLDCQAGHAQSLEEARMFKDEDGTSPFCFICGEKVFTTENLKGSD